MGLYISGKEKMRLGKCLQIKVGERRSVEEPVASVVYGSLNTERRILEEDSRHSWDAET